MKHIKNLVISAWCLMCAGSGCLSVVPRTALALPALRTVALTGQNAPGTSNGVAFSGGLFGPPALNDRGQVAFRANLTDGIALWSEGSGSLDLLAHSGSQVPDAPAGVTFSDFGAVVLNDSGQVAFTATSYGPGLGDAGSSIMFLEQLGQITTVVRTRTQAVGMPANARYYVDNLINGPIVLNNIGQTAFTARVLGGGVVVGTNDAGIWRHDSDGLSLVARSGDSSPDTSAGVVFVSPNSDRPFDFVILNDAGQTAIRASLSGSGVDSSNNSGIWMGAPGDLHLVVRAGDQAPGTLPGVKFTGFQGSFASPSLNEMGHIAFTAGLIGTDVNSANIGGIWSNGSGNLRLVVRKGDTAPGMPAGVSFEGFGGSWPPGAPMLNNSGQIAFYATLAGSGVSGWSIWSEKVSGDLAVAAYRGSQAPGTPVGVTFAEFDFRSLVLNDAGQVAFVATLMGTGVNASNDVGIWATDPNGVLQLVAREGDLLEVAPGDFRTITALDFSGGTGNGDGKPSGFNNLGQLAFHAQFTYQTDGIFVSNVVAIPEPRTHSLVVMGLLALSAFRGRFSRTVPRTRIGEQCVSCDVISNGIRVAAGDLPE